MALHLLRPGLLAVGRRPGSEDSASPVGVSGTTDQGRVSGRSVCKGRTRTGDTPGSLTDSPRARTPTSNSVRRLPTRGGVKSVGPRRAVSLRAGATRVVSEGDGPVRTRARRNRRVPTGAGMVTRSGSRPSGRGTATPTSPSSRTTTFVGPSSSGGSFSLSREAGDFSCTISLTLPGPGLYGLGGGRFRLLSN